jgi:hypothetical protein
MSYIHPAKFKEKKIKAFYSGRKVNRKKHLTI